MSADGRDERAGHVVGFDLGGTKLMGALADRRGTVLAERTQPTATSSSAELLDQLRGLAQALVGDAGVERSTVQAIGLGIPGAVDPVSGRIDVAPNIPDLNGIALADELAVMGGDPRVAVENDANLAALGERWRGLGADCDHFAFVAIGTAVGAGIVIDGELYAGPGGAAGEIGYLPLGGRSFDPAAPLGGPLDEAAGGRGIAVHAAARLAAGAQSRLREGCTAADVFAAAAEGDDLACESVEREARLVATAIASLSAVLAPELVILGGSIGANELLLEPVRRYSRELTPRPPRIERSALGPRAALMGAVSLGLRAAELLSTSIPEAVNTR